MHLVQVLPRLVQSGFHIAVHTISGRGALADDLEAAGVEVIVPPGAGGRHGRGLPQRATRVVRAALSLRRQYMRWRPDVVNFYLPEAYLVGALVALLFPDIKRVMSRRSLNYYQSKHLVAAWLERRLHRQMDAILANADAVVRQLIAEGAQPERVHLVRNGIDFARFEVAEANTKNCLGIASDLLVISIVANLISYKGHEDLFAALARINRSLPPWCLLCVGRDDGIGAELKSLVKSLNLNGKVRILGPRSDVPAILHASDIVVLASHEEGFPNVVIEAMAAGKPVIATRVGGVAEAVVDGITGMIVPPRDPETLSRALLLLAGDRAMRERMGAAGQARVKNEFSLDGCVARYAMLYQSVTHG